MVLEPGNWDIAAESITRTNESPLRNFTRRGEDVFNAIRLGREGKVGNGRRAWRTFFANYSRSPKFLQINMDKKSRAGARAPGTNKSATTSGKSRTTKGGTHRPRKPNASLAAPSAMGGVVGGGGYDFQTRLIVCHIPEWLAQDAFTQFFHEGTGDVDVEFGNSKRREREHIQVKDHEVKTKTEFKAVIETVENFDQRMPDGFKRFTLACPSLGPEINRLRLGLERLRQGSGFFGLDQASALRDTLDDVQARISKLGLAQHEQFILDKLYFQLGSVNYHNDEASCDAFIGSLLKNPSYSGNYMTRLGPPTLRCCGR